MNTGYYRTPSINGETIAFITEDDVWSVAASGGVARRLTTNASECSLPRLSPDGTRIAFVGRDEGHPEISVMPTSGGPARRLTFLGADVLHCSGWSPEGNEIYFCSDARTPFVKETAAFAVPCDGGPVRALELGHAMSFATRAGGGMLIGRNNLDPARWKRYRGGTAGQLWIDPRGESAFTRLHEQVNGNLVWPMWLDERVYFLSDHTGIGNLFSSLPDGSDLRAETSETEYFVRFPATDGKRIVYACGGEIVVFDPASHAAQRVAIDAPSSSPQLARRFIEASDYLERFVPSPDGTSLALISRGRPFAMPLWEEAVTDFGTTSRVRARAIDWMHDGKRLIYIDDAHGFERVAVVPLDQSEAPTYVTTQDYGRITELAVSPVGDVIAIANHRHELHAIDCTSGESRLIDTGRAARIMDVAIAPDGRWVAYTYSAAEGASIIRIAALDGSGVHDATPLLRVDRAPAWDPDGKYLYFISTRDFNPVYDALQFDLSFPQAARPFLITLRADVANPFVAKPAPLHRADKDDEKSDDEKDEEKNGDPTPIAIDFEGLTRRVLGFPVEEGDYEHILAVKNRALFTLFPVRGIPPQGRESDDDEHGALMAYDFETHRTATLANDIDDVRLSIDRRTLIYAAHDKLRVIDAGGDLPEEDGEEPKPPAEMNRRSGWLDLARASVLVEPQDEWHQMYREAWRLQREQFWDAAMSGIDWESVFARYERLVSRVRTRGELSDLIWEMQGELGTSHAYEIGGDYRPTPQYRRGFLGADIAWNEGGYRINSILRGDSWDRDLDSPLAEPGLDVRVGDTIVAIGGRPVDRSKTPDELLVNQAGRDVVLSIARDGETRRVLVHALRDERLLRYRAWVERNRAVVHERTDGAVGYLHIPDMGPWGFSEFHRGYLSEFDRDGLIVDVRYNRGGHVSPLLLEKLTRKRVGYDVSRYGPPMPYPPESVGGPIVALTNQFAGSDGDIFSHCFKIYKLGPLVGKRTWGGVVGINPYHRLVDGTITTQPEYSFWFVDVGWGVENYGTDPDYDVDIAPQDSHAGRDPQLEKALELMAEARKHAAGRPEFTARPNLGRPSCVP